MTRPAPDDLAQMIAAYAAQVREQIDFVDELRRQKRRTEALLLCCCYIDGLAQGLFYPEEVGSHQAFVRAVRDWGGDRFLPLVHPRHMLLSLNRLSRRRGPVYGVIRDAINPLLEGTELLTQDEFLARSRPLLAVGDYKKLAAEVWRGTMASLAYQELRSPLVHRLRGPDGISFDRTTYQGQPVPLISFEVLRPVLDRVFDAAVRAALEQGRFL